MRAATTKEKLLEFMAFVGRSARGPGSVYIVGGSSGLLLDIREQTLDIDLKLDPEPLGIFQGIAAIKERLQVNVEFASPDQFLPALPGWRQRSEFIERVGNVDFYHYDFYGQALSKIDRGHQRDLDDVRALIRIKKVDPRKLFGLLEAVEPEFDRYPHTSYNAVLSRLTAFLAEYVDVKD